MPSRYYAGLTCKYFDLAAKRWITPHHARNEPLDTLVYAYWAALCPMVRLDLRREHEWKALEDQLEPEGDLFAVQPMLSMPSAAVVDAAMVSSPDTLKAKPVKHAERREAIRVDLESGQMTTREVCIRHGLPRRALNMMFPGGLPRPSGRRAAAD